MGWDEMGWDEMSEMGWDEMRSEQSGAEQTVGDSVNLAGRSSDAGKVSMVAVASMLADVVTRFRWTGERVTVRVQGTLW
eukprot:CAMPEP_0174715308 /NCGR_PEP_ID=MMETSP1094-20130205/21151_1 /TAXON_ID=156173 /ORGANISM="Chrysochromulina brevifilum, Strain UTEX LB 985" /LENGTH=78 /DNA_ID=CAMNT_0015914867 /DNA_START=104 /DNA_END=341 /DNA_ORIENTATION=+